MCNEYVLGELDYLTQLEESYWLILITNISTSEFSTCKVFKSVADHFYLLFI